MALVLIIEDEPAIATVLRSLVRHAGHETLVAADGDEGWQLLSSGTVPDVVITDLNMPGVSGDVVLARMRSDSRLKAVPVILVTGVPPGSPSFPPEPYYQAYIEKPFSVERLLTTLDQVLKDPGEFA